jgi:hypothetical protein
MVAGYRVVVRKLWLIGTPTFRIGRIAVSFDVRHCPRWHRSFGLRLLVDEPRLTRSDLVTRDSVRFSVVGAQIGQEGLSDMPWDIEGLAGHGRKYSNRAAHKRTPAASVGPATGILEACG